MTTPSTRGRTPPPAATGASGGAGRDSHSRPVAAGAVQRLVIHQWLPESLANGQHGHWSTRQRKLHRAQRTVWLYAWNARLTAISGRAKVTIVLVFPVKRRRDQDNLHSRVKGVLDGLVKGHWLVDDSTEWLELEVRAEVRPGVKQTEITLEALP